MFVHCGRLLCFLLREYGRFHRKSMQKKHKSVHKSSLEREKLSAQDFLGKEEEVQCVQPNVQMK